MGSTTPLLDILSTHLPTIISSSDLASLSSSQARNAIETLLSFALGGDCPTRLHSVRQEWSRNQPGALSAIQNALNTKDGAKRARDSQESDETSSKRQKTAEEDKDDPPLFTLPSISTTSPVRKKVDVTVHARSIRFVNPGTRALESTISLASIARAFLLPTRGKTKGHWTVVLLTSDVPDKAKTALLSAQQIIFGIDALSAAKFETTSYDTNASRSTTIIAKGEETASSLREFLSHIPVPLFEPSATVFRSACATAKSGEGAAGIDAYLSAKQGTLWFFDSGILWGESKPCEFWAVSDLVPKDGIRIISATGRTCTVILGRKKRGDANGADEADSGDDDDEIVETEFSMVDGREQDPIQAWARNRKHLFGKPAASALGGSSSPVVKSGGSKGEVRPGQLAHANGTVKGPAWDDSDSDDEDFEVTTPEDLEYSSDSNSSGGGSDDESGNQSEDAEESGEEPEDDEGELDESRHPLLRPGAMPRMSKAAIDMVVDMVHDDFLGDASDEEDELEE